MPERPLFSYIRPPEFRVTSPDAVLSERDYELLRITVEDFRFVTREVTENMEAVAADVRSRSTILRRLLCVERDLFSAGRLIAPKQELRVNARMLDFDPAHPAVIVSCGNYPWSDDILPGMGAELSIKGVEPTGEPTWEYRDAEVSLSEYLDGLAVAVLGTRIRRWQVVKYVADKKAAHVSDKRKNLGEQALDRAWSTMSMSIHASTGDRVQLNVAYLEIMALIKALRESASINAYIQDIARWISTAAMTFTDDVRPAGLSLPIDPVS